MSLSQGEILHDRYRIEGQLGKGGMGTVYMALDLTLHLRVAVKENLNPNPESERQFRREASLLAGLRHPNLPRVTDHFILEGRQYLVMDFIEGVDLHTRAHQETPTVDEVQSWAMDACDALAFLHSRQPPIIHRDIKPANLKLQPDGKVVLVDFGIAKVFDQAQTTTGARGLTPGYSPPEQYGGSRTDHRSDQYALAATIYSLLTGQPPTDSIERMLNKEVLVPVRQLNPKVSEQVEAALDRALALDQNERFADMASFKTALQGRSQLPTVRREAPRVPKPAPARPSRAPVAIFAGLGALGLLLLGGGGLLALSGGGLLASNTATPTHPASATPAVGGALTTDMPAPSPTLEASATPAPTETATAVALIGGGGRIAFVSNREDGATLQIWTMNPDGSDPRQLTFGPGNKAQPRWSPDGQRLLYVAPGGRDDFGNDLGTDLFIMNADGTHSVNLTHNVGDDRDPAWGPTVDIAFTSTRNNNVPLVYLMKVACPGPEEDCTAEKPRSITMTGTYAPEHSPAWAPDGRLAVVANVRGAPGRIYFGGAGGGGTLFDRSDQLLGVDHLEWSPDGAFIALTWTISSGRNEIYLVPVDNPREHAQLTESRGNKEPAFSPDGRWIIFTSTRDQNPEVYLMSSTGGNQQNLSQSPFVDMQPDWSPKP